MPDQLGFKQAFGKGSARHHATDRHLRVRHESDRVCEPMLNGDPRVVSEQTSRNVSFQEFQSLGILNSGRSLKSRSEPSFIGEIPSVTSESQPVARRCCARGFSLPTSACTPPRDDYDYDCDVNRGPTFNHVRTGVSLLLLVAFDCAGRSVDRSSLS